MDRTCMYVYMGFAALYASANRYYSVKLLATLTEYSAIRIVLIEQMELALMINEAIGIVHPSFWRAVTQLWPVLFVVQTLSRTPDR